MGAWSRVRSALGVTLVAHVVVLGLSLAPSIPLALLLHRAVGDTAAGDASLWEAGGAVLIEALHETGAGIGAVVLVWLAVGGLGALVAPWLTMSWLAALARPGRVSAALGTGALRYFPALAVSALHAPLLALCGVLLVALPAVAGLVLAGSPNAQTHDLVLVATLVPGLALTAWVALSHDLGRAALAVHDVGAWRATRLGMRAALRPSALPAYLGWLALGLALVALGLWVGGLGDVGAWWATLVTLLAQQAIALLRTVVRARWLAGAVVRVERLAVAEPGLSIPIGGAALVKAPEHVPDPSQPPPRPRAQTIRMGDDP